MTQQTLTFPRDHDLPPKWDRMPVRWDGWRHLPPMFICPPPKLPEFCETCGVVEQQQTNVGRVYAGPDFQVIVLLLAASRCRHCGTDIVVELDGTGRGWVLDDTDYGDEGSRAP